MELEKLNDVDLHLYLAGALPWPRRFLMAWHLALDPGLRTRLASLRGEADAYRNREMTSLEARLFPRRARSGHPSGRKARASSWLDFLPKGGRPLGLALSGSFAVLILCAVPYLDPARDAAQSADGWAGEGPDIIAKGRGLGVSLYVKGDSAYRVENHAAKVAQADTLQAVPLGSAPQHLVLLGWDARQGLVRLFPSEGSMSRKVSAAQPPPALLLQGMEDNRLVCITSSAPFRIEDAEALIKRRPFLPLTKAPVTHLDKGLYVQVFAIGKTRGGRI